MKYVPPLGSTDANASYVGGDPSSGIRGSYTPAAVFEVPQREIINAIVSSGQTPDPGDLYQLWKAMQLAAEELQFAGAEGVKLVVTGSGIGATKTFSWDIPDLNLNNALSDNDLFGYYSAANNVHQRTTWANILSHLTVNGGGGGGGGGIRGAAYFGSPGGTWQAPSGVSNVFARVWGAGGAGGGGSMCACGGGAGGQYREGLVAVSPGTSYSVVVGAGGVGTVGNGNAGGTSSFAASISSPGGAGAHGQYNSTGGGAGPTGGGSGGQIAVNGNGGEAGVWLVGSTNGIPWSGWGGGTYGTPNSAYAVNDLFIPSGQPGGSAGNYPGGGGGGVAEAAGVSLAGGAGADGLVILIW